MSQQKSDLLSVTLHLPNGDRTIQGSDVIACGALPNGVLFVDEKASDGGTLKHVGVPHTAHFAAPSAVKLVQSLPEGMRS